MRAWCTTCRRMQRVMDTYQTDSGDQYVTRREYLAEPLECGHSGSDGSDRPAVDPRFTPDPTLVDTLVALQQAAR